MTPKEELKIAAVQMNSDERDKENNLDRMELFVKRAAAAGADIISFPEICITGYNFILYTKDRNELLSLAEEVPGGPSFERIKSMAKEYSITILFGLLEKTADLQMFNTYVAIRPNETFERYHKIHAFENSCISQGASHPIFDLYGWKCGVLICFDNNLVENPRIYALNGCEIIFAPHQTGAFDIEVAGMGRIDIKLWQDHKNKPEALRAEFMGPKGREWILKWLPCRAYDNSLFYIFTNGVGLDRDEVRTGNAMILDPNGSILAESQSIESDMVIATLRRRMLGTTLGKMHLKTRTPELYGDLVKVQTDQKSSRDARNEITVHSRIV